MVNRILDDITVDCHSFFFESDVTYYKNSNECFGFFRTEHFWNPTFEEIFLHIFMSIRKTRSNNIS